MDNKKQQAIRILMTDFGHTRSLLRWVSEEQIYAYLEAKGRAWDEEAQRWEERNWRITLALPAGMTVAEDLLRIDGAAEGHTVVAPGSVQCDTCGRVMVYGVDDDWPGIVGTDKAIRCRDCDRRCWDPEESDYLDCDWEDEE